MSNITQTPSFVFGYWRPWKENSDVFDSYMDYHKDVSLANYTAGAVGSYIQQASEQQVSAINNLAYEIGYGMDVLSSQMENVSGELRFLNRNMDIQIEQQKLSNLLLQDIAELLRVPDSEKERQLCIEMGVKFLVNAAKDPDLYDDALEELHKAEELRKQDYFVLHRLGTIYLYTEKHMNPEKALDYFLLAAKYASVESDPEAMRLANVMTQSFDTVNSGDSTESIQHLAGDSYEKAAFTCYVLGRFEEAEKNQQKALKLHPSPENKFLLAKYAVRSGNIDAGVKQLSEAIDESPELMGGVFKELDLANEKAVLEMIKKKNDDVDSEIDEFIEVIISQTNQTTSSFTKSIEELKSKSFEIKCIDIKSIKSHVKMYRSKIGGIENEVLDVKYKDFIGNYFDFYAILIEGRKWMGKNLDVDTFRNGDPIPHAETDVQWKDAGEKKQPAWCWSSNDPDKRKEYGKLYNHYAVADPRGLAPDGWRIPTQKELESLTIPDSVEKWKAQLNPAIKLPLAGIRSEQGRIIVDDINYGSEYWSISVIGPEKRSHLSGNVYSLYITNDGDGWINDSHYEMGFPVRCLKDFTTPEEKKIAGEIKKAKENELAEKKKIDEEKKRADEKWKAVEGIRRAEQKKKAEANVRLVVKFMWGIAISIWLIYFFYMK
jgi:uncharacterized protein (TIGR02145 family)